jgi:formylglycine-generating enzyme required for sulfatase activity
VTREAGVVAPQPVGTYPGDKARWGVMGMLGNINEWTSTRANFYPGNPRRIPNEYKDWVVVRGGSFVSDRKQKPISGTYRDWFPPDTKYPTFGFRLVRVNN